MSSERQISANKLNAKKSTGPRTTLGKKTVSYNALKHGLTAQDVVLPNEDPDEFESFRADLVADLAPKGALESTLAEQIIGYSWRLRRIPVIEAAVCRRGCQELVIERAQNAIKEYESQTEFIKSVAVADLDRNAYEDCKSRLKRNLAQLDEPALNVAQVFAAYTGPLINLWRHELALSRSLSKVLHELQRLQAARAGEYIPAPAMVDVNISLPEIVEETNKAN